MNLKSKLFRKTCLFLDKYRWLEILLFSLLKDLFVLLMIFFNFPFTFLFDFLGFLLIFKSDFWFLIFFTFFLVLSFSELWKFLRDLIILEFWLFFNIFWGWRLKVDRYLLLDLILLRIVSYYADLLKISLDFYRLIYSFLFSIFFFSSLRLSSTTIWFASKAFNLLFISLTLSPKLTLIIIKF